MSLKNSLNKNDHKETDSFLNFIDSKNDMIFQLMSDPKEGWAINVDGDYKDVPLNILDSVACRFLKKSFESKNKIAIALPKVISGVSLSMVIYLIISNFVKRAVRGWFKDNEFGIQADYKYGRNLIIATKDTKLRKFFLDSRLFFHGKEFSLKDFPIFRLRQSGNLVPIVSLKNSVNKIHVDPSIFFHFGKMDITPNQINNSCLIGEITESMSINMVKRLLDFIETGKVSSSLIIINEYSEYIIKELENSGFSFFYYLTDYLKKYKSDYNGNFPSLCSTLSKIPNTINISAEVIEDSYLENKLSNILNLLTKINKEIGSSYQLILIRAWSLFYTLKNLSVPLSKLEKKRKLHPWHRTIKFNLDKLSKYPLNTLNQKEFNAIKPYWKTIINEFKELYGYLEQDNKKYKKITEYIQKSVDYDNLNIVLYSKIELETLKEELLLDYEWDEYNSKIKVDYINNLLNNFDPINNVFLTGFWSKSQNPKLLSLLPKNINVMCYSFELLYLKMFIEIINSKDKNTKINSNKKLLKNIFGLEKITNTNIATSHWLKVDDETELLFENIKEFIPDDSIEMDSIEKLNDYWIDHDEIDEEDIDDYSLENGEEEFVEGYEVHLDNGNKIFIPKIQELLVYSSDNEKVTTKFVKKLENGDLLLIYTDEQNREMFQNIKERTEDLSEVDTRIVNYWKTALNKIINSFNSFELIIDELKQMGCMKVDVTIKQWLDGKTIAPRDRSDIELMLKLANMKNSHQLSILLNREIERLRAFHRKIGHRLKRKLSAKLKGLEIANDPIDAEIDEILETAEAVTVEYVSEEMIQIPKRLSRNYIFG